MARHHNILPTLSPEDSTDSAFCIEGVSHQELTEVIANGKANHEEVLDAGQKAEKDVRVGKYTTKRSEC